MSEVRISDLNSPVGLIAGSGSLPMNFIQSANAKGLKVVTVAHVHETDSKIEQISSACTWIKVGQLGKLIKSLKKAGVKHATFAGGIYKPRLFSNLSLDLKGWLTILKLKTSNDDTLLRGIAKEIEKSGIKIFSAGLLLENSLVNKGKLTRRGLSTSEIENAVIGWQAAELIGKCDIGQTVVINQKSIVAVEAVEGTDSCIDRAGQLSGKGSVIVKLSKPGQDERFDLPAIGVSTIENMQAIGATALVLRADSSIMLNPQEVIEAADRYNIALEAWTDCQH
jgi:DUF1009 family protein